MKARLWDRDNDYETLVKWWNDWEFGVVPKDCLPKDGIIVEDDNKPICFTGLYSDPTTKFCIMEWTVIDKNISHIKSHKALQLCIDSVIEMAKEKGKRLMYTVTGKEALHKRYEKYHGFKKTESNVTTFINDLYDNVKDLECFQDDEQWELQHGVNKGK